MMTNQKVLDFVTKHRISVLTTLLKDGTPHSAALHYASSAEPLSFVILTDRDSRKCQALENDKLAPASLVIGFSEEEWVTLQMEGEAKIVQNSKELNAGWELYTKKYHGADKYKNDPDSVVLKFIPHWWRYTELKPKPPKIISSQD